MDQYVATGFASGRLTPDTSLLAVNGIGQYLYDRIRRGLNFPVGNDITIHDFVKKFKRKSAAYVNKILQTVLQNKRANQCVNDNTVSNSKVYQVGDINKRGYEVCVAILRYAKTNDDMKSGLRFGRLMNLSDRTDDTKSCPCQPRSKCTGDCRWIGNACISRDNTNATGFDGVDVKPGQIETFQNQLERRRILAAASVSQNFRNDLDSISDFNSGHPLQMRYKQYGNQLWRLPGPRVRYPL